MIYYNTKGEIIPESEVDLKHGYLVDREMEHHAAVPAVTHVEQREIPNGHISYVVVDKEEIPAYDEVISQTYVYTGATELEKMEAQLMYTAVMTDTILGVEDDV